MKRIRKTISVILAVLTILLTLCIGNLSTSAATSGSINNRTITVTTKANYFLPGASSITLKQSKGTYTYTTTNWFGKKSKPKTGSCYGYYYVTANPISGKGKRKCEVFCGASKTIKLDTNTTYAITVSYNSTATWLNSNCTKCGDQSWKSTPQWRVSSTWKVSNYY